MSYVTAVNLLFFVITGILWILFAHYVFFAFIGFFSYKKFPHTDHKNRYGLIVPAKNEEAVIATIINSIRSANYPQELLDIFVVAHNCTDKTAAIARKMGAHVYEYNNPNENTMGYAFRYLFDKIEVDFGRKNYDGFFIFNADNTFDKNYFDKMNDAFEYYGRKDVISSFRQASNFNANIMTALYGIYFATSCYLGARGRTLLSTSNRIFGCGYVISSDLVKDGWKYVALTEDLEFSAKEITKGTSIRYCDEAVFYDEQPLSVAVMWRQRLRWARGILLVSRENLGNCIKGIFAPGRTKRFAVYDMATFCSRIVTFVLLMMILHTFGLLLAPFFGESLSRAFLYWDSSKSWWQNLFLSPNIGLIYSLIGGFINTYVISFITALMTMCLGWKRFMPDSVITTVLAMLLFPIFLMLQMILDVQAILFRNIGWKPIPHIGNRDPNLA